MSRASEDGSNEVVTLSAVRSRPPSVTRQVAEVAPRAELREIERPRAFVAEGDPLARNGCLNRRQLYHPRQ
jgi:hypothetical protein